MRPESSTVSSEEIYPSCQTTLWQIGQWRCEYWRAEGRWRGGALRLFHGNRLVRTIAFGLQAREQSLAWKTAIVAHPAIAPAFFDDRRQSAQRSFAGRGKTPVD